jgi:methyltransferase
MVCKLQLTIKMRLIPFVVTCGAVALLRLTEVRTSRRHEQQIIRRGGAIVAETAYRPMVLLHVGLLLGAPIEAALRPNPPPTWLSGIAFGALVVAFTIRGWALSSLGQAWSVRVLDDPARNVVVGGPYRHIRHPNYLAVAVEMAALPMCGGAYLTALFASLLNALVLRHRIALEEQVLFRTPAYIAAFKDRPRFLPRFRRS